MRKEKPRGVRATLKKHAAGGKITEIEKNTAGGTIVYEAEIVRDDKKFDIPVSATEKYLGIEVLYEKP